MLLYFYFSNALELFWKFNTCVKLCTHLYSGITLKVFFFILFRIILRRSSYRNWFNECYQTIAIYFAQDSLTITNSTKLWEKMWLSSFLAYNVFTVALLASIMYTILIVQQDVQQINSLEELLESNLTILYMDVDELALKPWLAEKYKKTLSIE